MIPAEKQAIIEANLVDYIVDNAESYLTNLPHNFSNSRHLMRRLIEEKPELVEKYLLKFVERAYFSDNPLYFRRISAPIKAYFELNSEKYEPFLTALFSTDNEKNNGLVALDLRGFMREIYPNKYQKELDLQANLSLIFMKKEIDRPPSIFETFLDLLLTYFTPEKAFSISSQCFSQYKYRGYSVLVNWYWIEKI